MNEQISNLFSNVTPRAKFGLGILMIIGLFLIWDYGQRVVTEKEIENRSVKAKLTALQTLRPDTDLDRLSVEAEALWASYESLLLQDETEGLNIATLQSVVIATLNGCGLEQVVANIEAEPTERDPAWIAYNVAVRARDTQNAFPICLSELAQLDVGLIVSDLTWRRGGNLQFELRAYSAADTAVPG